MTETCAECGFDSRRWRRRDARDVMDALGYWWEMCLHGLPAAVVNERPAPGVWSALEYGFHSALVTAVHRAGIEMIMDGDELPAPPDLGPAPEQLRLDGPEVLAMLQREGALLAAVARREGVGWSNTGRLPDGTRLEADALLLHSVHDATHHFMDVGRGLAAIGAGPPAGVGTLQQINVSGGGVPKQPVPRADIGWVGLAGDRQRDLKHHGRPFQAVCLWSADVIDELARAGHPIGPGSAGENLTLTGLDWAALRPGTRLLVGGALVELSWPAVPCHNQAQWFADGDYSRIAHERNPHWVRWYGWVRQPGPVAAGDQVRPQS